LVRGTTWVGSVIVLVSRGLPDASTTARARGDTPLTPVRLMWTGWGDPAALTSFTNIIPDTLSCVTLWNSCEPPEVVRVAGSTTLPAWRANIDCM
jgi:hypothetical protein